MFGLECPMIWATKIRDAPASVIRLAKVCCKSSIHKIIESHGFHGLGPSHPDVDQVSFGSYRACKNIFGEPGTKKSSPCRQLLNTMTGHGDNSATRQALRLTNVDNPICEINVVPLERKSLTARPQSSFQN